MNSHEIQLLYIYILIFNSLFMVGFLQEVARDVFRKKGDALAQCRLVFPSQRAKTTFYQELSEIIQTPVWKPVSLGMDELIASVSALKVPSSIELMSVLYQSYVQVQTEQQIVPESFDRFYGWGEVFLADFDAIDKHLLDAETVLMNVEDLKEIDTLFHAHELDDLVRQFWETSLHQPNEAFFQTWKILYPLYTRFHETLLEKGWAYSGMQYRNAVQHLDSMDVQPTYIFIGFNALNPCEQAIFDFLKSREALFYWDCDDYYVHGTHEAGHFMRTNLARYGNALQTDQKRIKGRKNIHLYAAESDLLQCKLAGSLAQGKTCLVLVNEQLLLPCIHSIPPQAQSELNITMGYPFRLSTTYGWIKDWLTLCLGSDRLEHSTGQHGFFAKDIIQFIDNQAIRNIILQADELKQELLQSNHRIIESAALGFTEIPPAFLRNESGIVLTDHLLQIIDQMLLRSRSSQIGAEETETLSFTYEQMQLFKRALEQSQFPLSIGMTARLIQKHLFSLNMTIESDRNADMQIMGFLESRALDFENLIILSANEDRLPGNTNRLSFIPFSIRCAFGLPTHKEKEAMYAYYFFRLLQRSETVHLIYNNSTSANNTGEMSRYIQQIQMELMEQPLPVRFVALPTQLVARAPLDQPKSGPAWEEFIEKPTFSASSLNDYLECPLRFYYRKIAKLKLTDAYVSEVDGSLFGNIVHQCMHALYTPFGNAPIEKHQLNELASDTERLKAVLHQVYEPNGLSPEIGEGALLENIFLHFIQRIIRYDTQRRAVFSIHSMEAERELTPLELTVSGTPRTVYWNAVFDRVDRETGQWVVVDYKTGLPPAMSKPMVDAEQLFSDTAKGAKEARQTLLYSMLMEKDGFLNTKPLLYFVQKMHLEDYDAAIEIKNTDDPRQEFMDQLARVFTEFFDESIPFRACKESKHCTYCSFIHLCEPQLNGHDA